MKNESSNPEEVSKLIQILIFDGFDLLDAIAPYEVLSAGNMAAPNALEVELVSLEGPRAVPSGTGTVSLQATGKLDPERAAVVVVPGASGSTNPGAEDSVPAILGRAVQSGIPQAVSSFFESPQGIVATVCGGSLLLALGGILGKRPVVTHHLGMEVLAATGVQAVPARVVDDGNLVSAGGVTSGLDLGLHLLERLLGPQIAHAVEALFEYERRGIVWRPSGLTPSTI